MLHACQCEAAVCRGAAGIGAQCIAIIAACAGIHDHRLSIEVELEAADVCELLGLAQRDRNAAFFAQADGAFRDTSPYANVVAAALLGCWWFVNNPSLIDEITRMRMELLGTSFIPQHSDARILDQGYRPYEGPRLGVRGAVRSIPQQ